MERIADFEKHARGIAEGDGGVEVSVRIINKSLEDAAEKISSLAWGMLLQHDVLAELVGTSYRNGNYTYRVSKLKKLLERDFGIFLGSVHRVGYRKVDPSRQIDECENMCFKGMDLIWTGVRRTQYIRMELIDDEDEKNRTIMKRQKMGNLVGLLHSGNKRLELSP